MTCYARNWHKFDTLRWHRTCEDLLFLIHKASASSLPDSTQSYEDEHSAHTKESEVAHAILQDIDNSRMENIDGFREPIETFRRREESAFQYNPEHAKREDEQYSRWREEFDVSESLYSDDLIRRLLKIAGPGNVCDAAGFMFWRARRVMEMQGEEDTEHGAGIETHGGTQLSEEEPDTERAENGANPSHGQSTALSEGPLAIGDGRAETGERNNDTEHGELWHGTAVVPISYTFVLTHN